jgi:TusA-related sulfurtransferase
MRMRRKVDMKEMPPNREIVILVTKEQAYMRIDSRGNQFNYRVYPGDVIAMNGDGVIIKTINHNCSVRKSR